MQLCTDFGLRAVLGEMSVLVAVPTLDVLTRVVSVRHPLHRYPVTLVFVIDPSLKHTVNALLSLNVSQHTRNNTNCGAYPEVSANIQT